MKILYFQGGPGNQLFQWAFLRYLQKMGRTDVRIDASAPSLRHHTGFELYRLFPRIAASGLRIPYWIGRPLHLMGSVLKEGFRWSSETGEVECNTLIFKGKLWIRGYWGQARFAETAREELLRDFTFSEPTDAQNVELLHRIDTCNAVSVHVRGGDYRDPATSKRFGGICTPAYYREAIRRIKGTIENPRFFIFSDDPDYAREVLGEIGEAVYVTHNKGMESYRDMQLMSRCRHHILANSTFSWWGAWLDPRPDKRVYVPSPWLHVHPGEPESSQNGLLPDEWIRITAG